jgi:hypothetical protein
MRTFTSNLLVLSATVSDTTISGKAIDRDISIDYSVGLNDVNQAIFVPEANLVVTGSLRINPKEPASINVWINSVVALVSLPAADVSIADEVMTIAPAEQPVEIITEVLETPAPKVAKKSNSRKKANVVEAEAELIEF